MPDDARDGYQKQIAELCRKAHGYRHAGEKFERVGKELAKNLHMPHFRIRARLIQLGNIEAKGALNYVARELIEPFAFNTDSWREEQHTFVVDEATVKPCSKTESGSSDDHGKR
jgi:malonyl CoA-acyl carrier protein transacylase